MAIMIPNKIETFCNDQHGEIKTYIYLKNTLPDDHYVFWHLKTPDGGELDFLIISPDIGLVVLEVKDWSKFTEEEISTYGSPIQQSNGYINSINNKLKGCKKLLQTSEKYSDHLDFCYASGVVLHKISKEELSDNEYYLKDKNKFFLKDDFNNDNPDILREKLYLIGENKFIFEKLSEIKIKLIIDKLLETNNLDIEE